MNTTAIIILAVIAAVLILLIILSILRKMKGSIQIIPEKYSYAAGEDIKGKVILKLKKAVVSEKLIIGIKCEKNQRNYSTADKSVHNENYEIFDFNQPLDGKKQYAPGEYSYDFSIKAPSNISGGPGGIAVNIAKSIELLSGQGYSLKWYLYSRLTCEGVDLDKRIQINVS
jgi:hypothetical protein